LDFSFLAFLILLGVRAWYVVGVLVVTFFDGLQSGYFLIDLVFLALGRPQGKVTVITSLFNFIYS
jgi:hypothetical protein